MDANSIGRLRYIINPFLTCKHTVGGHTHCDRCALLPSESHFVHHICRSRHLLIRHLVGSWWPHLGESHSDDVFVAFLVDFSVAILVDSFGRISVGFSVVIW